MKMLASLVSMLLLTSAAQAQDASLDGSMRRKLALATQYSDMTHKQKLIDDVAIDQLKMAWSAVATCNDENCRDRLDADIQTSVHNASLARQNAEVQLLAERLTEDDLLAAIAFVQSPHGKAIIVVQNGMTNDLARIGHDFSQNVNANIYQLFCFQEVSACVRMKAGSAAKAFAHP